MRRIAAALGKSLDSTPISEPGLSDAAIKGELLPFKRDERGFVHANGWACNLAEDDADIDVEMFADDKLFAVVPADKPLPPVGSRPLAAKAFRVVVPPNFAAGETIDLAARVRTRLGPVEIGRRRFKHDPSGKLLANSTIAPAIQSRQSGSLPDNRSIAAIILTRDGDALLRGLLTSICEFEKDTFRRIVVVDHESADGTVGVVGDFSSRLPVHLLPASRENSFASSNNAGAKSCDEEVLVFLNNDIILTAPAIKALTSHLGPGVGLVGLKLTDAPPGGSENPELAVQDVGIHFWPTPTVTLPFESRWLSDLPEANGAAMEVPAVTAALAAIENRLFRALNGFDERYFYGWEDIDLNMKSLAAGHANISVNSISAVHLRGQTRHKLSQSQAPRRAKNPEIFAADWEYSLRRSLVRDLFDRVGFWTGRKAHVGIAIHSGAEEPDRRRAAAIGLEIAACLSCKVFLFEDDGAIDCLGVDALLAIGALPGLGKLRGLAATAWVAAWVDHATVAAESPEGQNADIWLAPSKAADALAPSQIARIFVDELKRRSKSGLRVLLRAAAAPASADRQRHDLVLAVRQELERLGHTARIAFSDTTPGDSRADAVVHLGGAASRAPDGKQINILWIPDSDAEPAGLNAPGYDDMVAAPSGRDARIADTAGAKAKKIAHALDVKLRALDSRKMRFR